MAKGTKTVVTGVQASSIALFEGVLAAAIGFFVAIVYSLRVTINLTQETSSVLAGLSLGLVTGALGIIILPLVYFAIGWLIGYVHGLVFNAIAGTSGGIGVYLDQASKK